MQFFTSTVLLSALPLAMAQDSFSTLSGTFSGTSTGSSSVVSASGSNSTTPGFPNHSTTPGGVPIPPVTPSVITTTSTSANYSVSLTVPTTASATSAQTAPTSSPKPVVITTTANGQTSLFTSLQVVTAGAPTNAGNTAAARPSGTLQNGASSMQSSVQAAAVAALLAVCGIMGTL